MSQQAQRQIFPLFLVVLSFLLFGQLSRPIRIHAQQPIPELPFGESIQRPLPVNETHAYRVILAANQFVMFELWQRGLIALVTIYGPADERLFQRQRTGTPTPKGGLHTIRFVAETGGVYRLELKALAQGETGGQYDLTFADWRPANEADWDLQRALRQLDEAGKLQARYDVGTPAERRAIRDQQEFDREIAVGEQSLATLQRLLPPSAGDIGNLGNRAGEFVWLPQPLRRH